MKKQDLAAAGKRKLEEFRKKKDKSAHAAAPVQEDENGATDEEARPDPNIWRRALENEINTLRSETGRLQAELLREQTEKALLQTQVQQVEKNTGSIKSQLERVERERRKAEELASSLRRNIETITGERNAAIAAKEDFAAQLRVARRRLQEAEEEQYRAEEDTAALRAEVERLEALSHGHVRRPSQEIPLAENELDKARAELQMTLTELQSSQQSVAVERQRQAVLSSRLAEVTSEKDELEHVLTQTRDKLQELRQQLGASQARATAAEEATAEARLEAAEARREAESKAEFLAPRTPESRSTTDDAERAELELAAARFVDEKRKLEGRCKELAMMVERQEKGRQKLLTEIDSQSLEIERLFGENAGLHAGLNEYTAIAARWEQQVHELLGQNQELRAALRQLREEQRVAEEARSTAEDVKVQDSPGQAGMVPASDLEEARAREAKLKKQLAQALAKAEELAEQCERLSADYNQVTHAMANLSRAYQPLLSGIESKLLQLR
ncbi:myosin heavy chain-related protein [Klebsormidium nitens]|uniref:Myosin heavy chain-related protein n=1 Tax=Klebsormidium nitens TaxID=105231 RepID=A0A1Y1IG42_KLENI|nr:myosin heavy chain-related protein [Klebsormidium nitens]|eukprot:GAQ87726.1 myosin heavy chain-related protein [Klebsormidium nitens]